MENQESLAEPGHTLRNAGAYVRENPIPTILGALAVGKRADLIVLDGDAPNLYGIATEDVLGSLVFCGNDNLVRHVMVGGQWVVRDFRHVAQEAITARYKQTLAELRQF